LAKWSGRLAQIVSGPGIVPDADGLFLYAMVVGGGDYGFA
jgi:hypothetical protein